MKMRKKNDSAEPTTNVMEKYQGPEHNLVIWNLCIQPILLILW